jgi:hypothetical protein
MRKAKQVAHMADTMQTWREIQLPTLGKIKVLTASIFKELAIGRRNYTLWESPISISSKSVTEIVQVESHLHPDDHQWADFDKTSILDDILKRTYIQRVTTVPHSLVTRCQKTWWVFWCRKAFKCTTKDLTLILVTCSYNKRANGCSSD